MNINSVNAIVGLNLTNIAAKNVSVRNKISDNNVDTFNKNVNLSFCGNVKSDNIQPLLSKTSENVIFVKTRKVQDVSFGGTQLNRKNILVTGGAGYIGSHTSRYLMEKGYNVIVLDNLSKGNKGALDELEKIAQETNATFKYYNVDLADSQKVGEILNNNSIDAVVHFAAYIEVGESVKDPLKYYINNTGKTALLLDQMLKNGVNKIVFSSTAATYGAPKANPINEDTPQLPINPYGKSKLMIETMMDDLNSKDRKVPENQKLKSIRLRYFNVAGSSSDGRIGESHTPESHLIPNVLRSLVDGKIFKLFGTDYDTKDGTCVRDYIHVEDLAKAHYLALEKLFNGGETAFYNLGSGAGYSVREVIKTAEKVTGKQMNVIEEGRRPGDPPILIASNDKARKELGWKPEKTLEDMISSAWKWFNNKKY